MVISLHSTSLTAVTFCILPNIFEWVLVQIVLVIVKVCTTPRGLTWFTRPFPCVRVVSRASRIFLLPHGNKEKYGWFTRPHKTTQDQCEGGIWASPETPMNTKQNVMQWINESLMHCITFCFVLVGVCTNHISSCH